MLSRRLKNQPLVSIVTPSYNQAQFLEENILSVRQQDYPNIEHIIIDGGSTDVSLDIIKKYAAASSNLTWISEPDRGQSHAINKGLRMAKGEIIGWLNSDDYYLPGAVSIAVDVLISNPGIGLVYGYCEKVDEQSNKTGLLKSPEFDRNLLFRNPDVIWQPTVFFRNDLLNKVGYLDEGLHFAMDYDFWLRMAKVTDFKLVPQALAAYRFSSSCKSVANEQEFWKEVDEVFRRHGMKINPLYLALHKSKFLHSLWARVRSPLLVKLKNRLFGFWESEG
ncbi:MAG: glycosyltransferase family 2 protein [Actinomycetota bacterium]|nr:glycosyltransferase family 2 protein [Actinomycetota bacterium]